MFLALLMMGSLGCCAQDASGTTNKTTAFDWNNDGKLDVLIETAYRGNAKLRMITSRPLCGSVYCKLQLSDEHTCQWSRFLSDRNRVLSGRYF